MCTPFAGGLNPEKHETVRTLVMLNGNDALFMICANRSMINGWDGRGKGCAG